jgi:putative transposase
MVRPEEQTMTDHDVAVATPSKDTSQERPDRSLAEQLVDQARADGKNLVGPGGLLSDLTKQVLETGLEVEMEEHLGYPKHASAIRNTPRKAATTATAATAREPRP